MIYDGDATITNQFMKNFAISSENIQVKIADFGFSRKLEPNSLAGTFFGTPLYMAPEIVFREEYSYNSDVWSLGCIFYEMIFGIVPFYVATRAELPKRLKEGCYAVPMTTDFSLEGALFLN